MRFCIKGQCFYLCLKNADDGNDDGWGRGGEGEEVCTGHASLGVFCFQLALNRLCILVDFDPKPAVVVNHLYLYNETSEHAGYGHVIGCKDIKIARSSVKLTSETNPLPLSQSDNCGRAQM